MKLGTTELDMGNLSGDFSTHRILRQKPSTFLPKGKVIWCSACVTDKILTVNTQISTLAYCEILRKHSFNYFNGLQLWGTRCQHFV